MGRTFVSASSQALTNATVLADVPFTVSMWVKMTDLSAPIVHYLFATDEDDTLVRGHYIQVWGNGSGLTQGTVRLRSNNNSTPGNAVSGTLLTAGQWYHICGVWTSTVSRSIYVDNAKVTDTTGCTVTGLTHTDIGRLKFLAQYGDFEIAFLGLWVGALTDAQVAQLALGFSPRHVKPTGLVDFWPMSAGASPEVGLLGTSLSLVGSPTKSDNPRIYY